MSKRLAMKFHEIYERLAPRFGYETRTETRAFDPTTPNGRLMIAVTDEIEGYHLDFNKALEEDYCALHQENDKLRAELARRDEIITRLIALGDALIADEAVFYSQEQAEHYTVVIEEWRALMKELETK